ncbi:hypothetical protein E2C01_071745 [Portunus trituberculatus]|uniref:Secreted protein n=1 Tax=Portunus trituberculatus TaxID=210409 RepID=A0A5B7I989_PORTR|nr:hypothetical protein [Portunus trituberculatus]
MDGSNGGAAWGTHLVLQLAGVFACLQHHGGRSLHLHTTPPTHSFIPYFWLTLHHLLGNWHLNMRGNSVQEKTGEGIQCKRRQEGIQW